MRKGVIGDENRSDANKLAEVHKRASGGSNTGLESDGGYLLETKVDKTIKQMIFGDSPILQNVDVIPLGPSEERFKTFVLDDLSRADGVRFGGITGDWIKEGETVTDSKAKLKAWQVDVHKFMARGRATSEMIRNAGQMEAIMLDGMRGEFRYKLAEAIVAGGGIDGPMGFSIAATQLS